MGGFGGRFDEDHPEIEEQMEGARPCPIPWRPSPLAPVLSGHRTYDPADGSGAPVPLEVWFPTDQGNPDSARPLTTCGPYPLVVFAHGGCSADAQHPDRQRVIYRHWSWSPMVRQQARAGYVVVVPQLPGLGTTSVVDLDRLRAAHQWMRTGWAHRDILAPETVVVGHSYGGAIGARLAAEGGIAAYAGLSPELHSWLPTSVALQTMRSIRGAKLFIHGSAESYVALDDSWKLAFDGTPQPAGSWDQLKVPKHMAFVRDMDHYDYVVPNDETCGTGTSLTAELSADLVTMFLGRHVPPPTVADVASRIPDDLYFPDWARTLAPAHAFFTASYLTGFARLERAAQPDRLALTAAFTPGVQTGVVVPQP
jgi:pimeloyl-ACP methyl ester carboxylesterase